MPTNCDIILRWGATPAQLTALGDALWRWCNRTAGNTGGYQYLDSQPLADLLAGKLPVPGMTPRQADPRGVHLRLRDEASQDRQATIDSLRREMPTEGIEDVVVEGASWSLPATPNGRGSLPTAPSQ
jgi:hypothetical protein